MNEGWSCPKCGKVYAPSVLACEECNAVAVKPYYPPALPWPSYPSWPWYQQGPCSYCGRYNCFGHATCQPLTVAGGTSATNIPPGVTVTNITAGSACLDTYNTGCRLLD
jgi:hypothetical protein